MLGLSILFYHFTYVYAINFIAVRFVNIPFAGKMQYCTIYRFDLFLFNGKLMVCTHTFYLLEFTIILDNKIYQYR